VTRATVQIVRDNTPGGKKISGTALADVVLSGTQAQMLHAQVLLQFIIVGDTGPPSKGGGRDVSIFEARALINDN
jgi:hypothetical protein